ncbi:MAG: hypothetical protein K6A65_07405 [Succinivibrionaceae bacterium]|nr:hypothetical protein [Succinivibrionaceae bacterium]
MIDFKRFCDRTLHGVGLGEVLFDVFGEEAKLGGAPANFAFHLGQMGIAGTVVSAVGDDALGRRAREELGARGLAGHLATVPFPTGRVDVRVDAQGVAAYDFLAGTAYDNLPLTDRLLALAATTDVACYGSLAQRSAVTSATIGAFLRAMPKGSLRVFDVNLRCDFYSERVITSTLALSNFFKCNEDELPVLAKLLGMPADSAGFGAALTERYGIDGFIYTQGGEGSEIFLNGERSWLPSKRVQVVDTVGAGDSFTATLIAALLRGLPLGEAHALATEVSGFVCTQRGAMPELPSELRQRLPQP